MEISQLEALNNWKSIYTIPEANKTNSEESSEKAEKTPEVKKTEESSFSEKEKEYYEEQIKKLVISLKDMQSFLDLIVLHSFVEKPKNFLDIEG